jgi:hypothetical protein
MLRKAISKRLICVYPGNKRGQFVKPGKGLDFGQAVNKRPAWCLDKSAVGVKVK